MQNNYRNYLFTEFFNFIGLYSHVGIEKDEEKIVEKLFVKSFDFTDTHTISLEDIPTAKNKKTTDKDLLEKVVEKLSYDANIDEDLLVALPTLIDIFCENQLLQSAITIKMNVGNSQMLLNEGNKFVKVATQLDEELIRLNNPYLEFAKLYSFNMSNSARIRSNHILAYNVNKFNDNVHELFAEKPDFIKLFELARR